MHISTTLSAVIVILLTLPSVGLSASIRKSSGRRTTQSIEAQANPASLNADVSNESRKFSFTLVPVIEAGTSSSSAEQPPFGSITSLSGPAFSVGVLGEIGPRDMKFQTGVLYMADAYNLTFAVESKDSAGNPTKVLNFADSTLHFVGAPLLAKYNFQVRQAADRVYLRAGVIPVLLLSRSGNAGMEFYRNNSLTSRYDQPVTDISRFRDLNVFATLSAGAEFDIDSKRDWRAEASYRRMLLSVTGSNPSSFSGAFLVSLAFGYDLDL